MLHSGTPSQRAGGAGAVRRVVLADDGSHLCLHHAAVVLRLLPEEQVCRSAATPSPLPT